MGPVELGFYRKGGKMKLEFSHEDLELMYFLLSKEESETIVEIHHCRNFDFREYLKQHYEHIKELLVRIRNANQVIPQS
jgi:predicted metallo-beta-lactamase superfamily hydrolase